MPITFAVDDVTPAAGPLPTRPLRELAPDALLVGGAPETPVVDHGGVHPLLAAVHVAFSQHRPLVLSPDVLWLTIAQGFAQHVRLHAESLRPRLVRHSGRGKIDIEHRGPPPRDPAGLGQLLAELREGLAREVGEGMPRLLVCDYSTTTDVERLASEVVLLDAYSPYFDYSAACVCGIPEVTLLGTPEDYRKIRQRVDVLCEFDLGFWRPSLVRIADAFVETAEGTPDRAFWRAIYKPREAYGWDRIMGWSARLYPYLQCMTSLSLRNPLLDLPFDFVLPESDDPAERHRRFFEGPGIRTVDVPATRSRVSLDVHDLSCTPSRRFAFDLEAGVTHIAQDAGGRLIPCAGYFLREHERSIHEAIERIQAQHTWHPPAPPSLSPGEMGEVVVLYDHMSSAVLFEGPLAWRLRKVELVGEGPYERIRGTIELEKGRRCLVPLLDLPGDRQVCVADGVLVCVRASDVKHDPGGYQAFDEITGLNCTVKEDWTLAATSDRIPVVARKLSDLLFHVLDGGPDVELPTLGTLRGLDEEREREWKDREEERRRNRTPEERENERKLEEELEERQRRREERRKIKKG